MNEITKTMIRDGEIGPEQSAMVYLIAGRRDWLQRRAEIARLSVRRWTAMGSSRGRLVGHSWGGGRHTSRVATEIMGR